MDESCKRVKNQWHPGFAAALQLEFRENRDDLEFEQEYMLAKKPLQMDMFIVKKDPEAKIENKIGRFFRKFNVIEYKSPDDAMNVDVYYKVMAYACLYKVSSEHEDGYRQEEMTVTLIRQRYPAKLMRHLKQNGCEIIRVYPGIYYISGNVMFPLQIVVTKDLDEKENIWLRSMCNNITKQVYLDLLNAVGDMNPEERELYGEAVLHVVTTANETKIMEWEKEGSYMQCEALNRIMAVEFEKRRKEAMQEGRQEGRQVGRQEGRVLAYADMGLSVEEIAKKVLLSTAEIMGILAGNKGK